MTLFTKVLSTIPFRFFNPIGFEGFSRFYFSQATLLNFLQYLFAYYSEDHSLCIQIPLIFRRLPLFIRSATVYFFVSKQKHRVFFCVPTEKTLLN